MIPRSNIGAAAGLRELLRIMDMPMEGAPVTISPIKTMSVGIDMFHVNAPLRSNSPKRTDPNIAAAAMESIVNTRTTTRGAYNRGGSTFDENSSGVNSIYSSLSNRSGRIATATERQQRQKRAGNRRRNDWRGTVLEQVCSAFGR